MIVVVMVTFTVMAIQLYDANDGISDVVMMSDGGDNSDDGGDTDSDDGQRIPPPSCAHLPQPPTPDPTPPRTSQDCEPVWRRRDAAARSWCLRSGADWVERVGHTLWNPHEVVEMNGGSPPLTFSTFVHVAGSIGQPERPAAPDVDLGRVRMVPAEGFLHPDTEEGIGLLRGRVPENGRPCLVLDNDLRSASSSSSPRRVSHPGHLRREGGVQVRQGLRRRGEEGPAGPGGVAGFPHAVDVYKKKTHTKIIKKMCRSFAQIRLERESRAFARGSFQPNQRDPDILCPPKSLSPDLRSVGPC